MWRGERQTISILKAKVDPSAQYVWFHAASLGEFEQGRPLIETLRKRHPEYKILLTFFSPSGYEVRKNYPHADIVCYLPLDSRRNARRFLRAVRPVMAFFIKYEFWYNYLHILRHRGVPVYSVSSIFRPDQVFFKWYGREYGRVLRCITKFFVQNEISRELLEGIGITAVQVVGDTRFDRVVQVKNAHKALPIVESFCQSGTNDKSQRRKVFVAGSSWQADEEVYLPYFHSHPDYKLIIAPHVIDEERLARLLPKLGGSVVRYTQTTPEEAANADVLIIDCFGLLAHIYGFADVAYVGGGFGVGIHNVLEAAVWGVPVLFGHNNKRFQEAQELKTSGGGIEVGGAAEFEMAMDKFAADEPLRHDCGSKAAAYVEKKSGITELVMDAVGL